MSRVRSPNYPAIGLLAAVEKAKAIHKSNGRNVVSRDALAKLFGYSGINGKSSTLLSAIGKYGLIENVKDGEMRISDLVMRILFGDSAEEKQAAMVEASMKPAIFAEMREKWPEQPPSDEAMQSFLMRSGFSETASSTVIQFYRELTDIAPTARPVQSALDEKPAQEKPMESTTVANTPAPLPPPMILAAPTSQPPIGGKPFSVAFDGSTLTGSMAIKTIRDIDKLVKVLQAQKAAFKAMHDDDVPDEDGHASPRDV